MSTTPPLHTPEAHDVITCELVACTLGQRHPADRLELRVDIPGRMAYVLQRFTRGIDGLLRAIGERPDYQAALAKASAKRSVR